MIVLSHLNSWLTAFHRANRIETVTKLNLFAILAFHDTLCSLFTGFGAHAVDIPRDDGDAPKDQRRKH